MARIITHDDTDGLVSAVLLYSTNPKKYDEVKIIGHGLLNSTGFKYRKTDSVLDLPQPDTEVEFWADHHFSGKKNNNYKGIFDSNIGSCSKLMYNYLKNSNKDLSRFEKLVEAGHKVDTADFKDVADLDSKTGVHSLLFAIQKMGHWRMIKNYVMPAVIEDLATSDDWMSVIDTPHIRAGVNYIMNEKKFFRQDMNKYLKVIDNKIALNDSTPEQFKKCRGFADSWAMYVKYPKSLYGMTICEYGKDDFMFKIGENPFMRGDKRLKHNLVKILKSNSNKGGGHKAVAAVNRITEAEKDNLYNAFTHEILSKHN